MTRFAIVALATLVLLASAARAEDVETGKMVTLTCKVDSEQKYSCYVPKAYDPAKQWPILYCFSPNANGDGFVQRYQKVCEERGWIVVGSMNSKNGPWEPIKAAINAMWADTAERFSLSDSMRYASGFSGGSRVSFEVASLHPKEIAGVIGIGAGLAGSKMPRPELAVFLTCGETDPNKAELDPLFDRLKAQKNPVQYENFDGGHDMPPTEILEKAVRWIDDLSPVKRAAELAAAVEAARALQADGEPAEAYVGLLAALAKCADLKDGRKDAVALQKVLEKTPEVKAEIKARKALNAALAWIEKNADRVAGYPAVRKQAVQKLQKVVEKHAGTPAAADAQSRLETLSLD